MACSVDTTRRFHSTASPRFNRLLFGRAAPVKCRSRKPTAQTAADARMVVGPDPNLASGGGTDRRLTTSSAADMMDAVGSKTGGKRGRPVVGSGSDAAPAAVCSPTMAHASSLHATRCFVASQVQCLASLPFAPPAPGADGGIVAHRLLAAGAWHQDSEVGGDRIGARGQRGVVDPSGARRARAEPLVPPPSLLRPSASPASTWRSPSPPPRSRPPRCA